MIIDAHSHIGEDYYCGCVSIDGYIQYCKKNGVNIGLLMPTPWPQYKNNNDKITSLLWEHNNYKEKKYYFLVNQAKKRIEKNPYKIINYKYNEIVKKNNSKSVQLYFIPLIHGILDESTYLEKMLYDLNPIAVKMHGFGSGFSPTEINSNIIKILKEYNVPIILHTSVYNYDYGYGASTKYWRNECHPYKWLEFLLENDLKGVLNHGACLHENTLKIVNETEKIKVGLGPDLDISKDFFKVDIPKEKYSKIEYLKYLKQNLLSSKILFDVDYNWNIDENGYLDYSSIQRISNVWNKEDLENILYKNALNFFKLSYISDKRKTLEKK